MALIYYGLVAITFTVRQKALLFTKDKEAIWEKRINLLMLLCVSGKGSHLVSVMHNSHTVHIHIHIFQYFLSFP